MYSDSKLKSACKLAIDNVLLEGTTDVDVFSRSFEIDYLKRNDCRDEMVIKVVKAIQSSCNKGIIDIGQLGIHKLGHVLVPKKSLSDFRKCALVDIYDEIVYLTLVLLIAPSIEKNRIKKKEEIIFSYRFQRDDKGRLFDPGYSFTSFRNKAYEKQKEDCNKVQVSCDISNFYDRLNLHRLNSILLSIQGIDHDTVEIINQLLLFWANRDSYGLPVGSNASRILAEAALSVVDETLFQHKIDYCRFVDDFRIFSSDAKTAHGYLALLTKALNTEGLFLNTGKTTVKDISQFVNADETADAEEDGNEADRDSLSSDAKTVIIRGYSGTIPTRFRTPSTKQKELLAENDLSDLVKRAKNSVTLEPEEIKTIIQTVVAQEQYDMFSEMPNILANFPQFVPYFVDAVLKNGDHIDEKTARILHKKFALWFDDVNLPEYIFVYLIRLFTQLPFTNYQLILAQFRDLKRNAGAYAGRALLESLIGNVTRSEVLEIRDYYYRADLWEKRAIIKIIKEGTPESEQRPFFKDASIHDSEDLFIKWIIKDKADNINR